MITVINAGALTGYSSTDHLIDDTDVKKIIGKQFKSVKAALKAADKNCFMETAKVYRNHPYTWVEVKMASGETSTHRSV